MIKFILIVNDPDIARHADEAGVERLMVDLEWMGKEERQGHLDSWKSRHKPGDVAIVREVAQNADLMVRINPLFEGSKAEIDEAIAMGADLIMLPMYRRVEEIMRLHDLVRGRARVMPLAETVPSVRDIGTVLDLCPPDELLIGLNDLSLDLGADFMFRPLAEGYLDDAAALLRARGVPFGIGGIGRLGSGQVAADLILSEHARLGSEWVVLSRSFHNRATTLSEMKQNIDLAMELGRFREEYSRLRGLRSSQLGINRLKLLAQIDQFVTRAD